MIPDLIELFLSGFIFMCIFSFLNNRKYDTSKFLLWCIFISYLIKHFCILIHSIIIPHVEIRNEIQVLTYSIIGCVLPFVIHIVIQSKPMQCILYKTSQKSINDDAFNDIIDYELPTMMQVYLKNSDIYYIGKFCYREEKGMDSWIVLINYGCITKEENKLVYDPDGSELKSVVAINMHDIERIEIIYEDDSKVWKSLSGDK